MECKEGRIITGDIMNDAVTNAVEGFYENQKTRF